jgi:hypothetical protein
MHGNMNVKWLSYSFITETNHVFVHPKINAYNVSSSKLIFIYAAFIHRSQQCLI